MIERKINDRRINKNKVPKEKRKNIGRRKDEQYSLFAYRAMITTLLIVLISIFIFIIYNI